MSRPYQASCSFVNDLLMKRVAYARSRIYPQVVILYVATRSPEKLGAYLLVILYLEITSFKRNRKDRVLRITHSTNNLSPHLRMQILNLATFPHN
jgi:hypothetical protein